jgi:sialic acid synthase SpsE
VPSGSENLRAIGTLADVFRVPVGLSDHARDTSAVPMAVALGASLYERHVMLGAGDGAIDSDVSSTPAALAALIDSARDAVAALGSGVKTCIAAERANRHASRRGLYAARPLEAGEVVAAADVVALRPAAGLPPGRLPELIGTTLVRAVERGAPFFPDDLHPSSRPGRVA